MQTLAAGRLAARLERLEHAQLVELCALTDALTCTLDAHDSRRVADDTLSPATSHDPLPT